METVQASFDYSKWENLMGESRKDALRVKLVEWSLRWYAGELFPKINLERSLK